MTNEEASTIIQIRNVNVSVLLPTANVYLRNVVGTNFCQNSFIRRMELDGAGDQLLLRVA